MNKFLHLAPRILGIVYILFLGVFALDVFSIEGSVPPYYLLVAFLLHLIPSFIVAILLLIAWRYEKAGGVFFILFAIGLAIIFSNTLAANVVLLTPSIIIGILFLLDNNYRTGKRI